jgi:hypothetical protein
VAALAHEERSADGADAAGTEHESEVAGGRMKIVLHNVGQQDFGRAHEGEVCDRSGEQGAPEPDPAPHERKAFFDGMQR